MDGSGSDMSSSMVDLGRSDPSLWRAGQQRIGMPRCGGARVAGGRVTRVMVARGLEGWLALRWVGVPGRRWCRESGRRARGCLGREGERRSR